MLYSLLLSLQLLPLTAIAFSLMDCRTMSRGGSSSPNAESILSANLTVQACVDICSSNSKAFALLGGAACRCITSKSALESTTYTVNMPECSLVCSDGLPCGSSVALNRFSVYNVTEASLPPTNGPQDGPGKNDTGIPKQGPNKTTNESVGPGNSINQQQIAIIVGVLAAVLIIIIVSFILIRRHRKRKAIPATPMIDSSGSTEYLIPKLLPRTPNQLYSVYAVYKARRQDELSLGLKQVVAIRNTYSDGWAMGTDLSTGAAGVFPLTCLIPDREKAPAHALAVPERTQASIQISMIPPPLTAP